MKRLVTLKEYAEMHNKKHDTVRRKALRSGFKTAMKVGRDWLIDPDEPYIDKRRKENKKD